MPPTPMHVLLMRSLVPTDFLGLSAHPGGIRPVAGFEQCIEDRQNISRILLAAACQLHDSDLAYAIVSRTKGGVASGLPWAAWAVSSA